MGDKIIYSMILGASAISLTLNLISTMTIFLMILKSWNRDYKPSFFNMLTLSGIVMAILNLCISNTSKILLFSVLLFPIVLRDHTTIFELHNVGKKITILSFGYTNREYFLRFLIPKNIAKLMGSFMKFFGVSLLFLFLLKNESRLGNFMNIGITLTIAGILMEIFNMLNIEKR